MARRPSRSMLGGSCVPLDRVSLMAGSVGTLLLPETATGGWHASLFFSSVFFIFQFGRMADGPQGKDYADYGARGDFSDDGPSGRLSSLGLGGLGSVLMCCLCVGSVFLIGWVVFVVVTVTGTPPLKEGCLDSGQRFFPGSIWDFVVASLCYTMVLPCFIGCLMAIAGVDSGLGRFVRFFNIVAAIYFPLWGISIWTNISEECETSFRSDPYANLFLVFQVEVILSAMRGVGAVGDICRPQVDPASLEGGFGYQQFSTDRPPTAPNPETEGFV